MPDLIARKAGCGSVDPEVDLRTILRSLNAEERQAIRDAGDDPDKPSRVLPWTISTEARDRDGDRIMVSGWNLKDYKRNPVVLFGHDHRGLPVGKSVKTWKDTTGSPRLRSIALFTPREMGGGFGFNIFELARGGFLPASSVGFLPREWERDAESPDGFGRKYTSQDLLEWSVVPVPSNPEALQGTKAAGIDCAPYCAELERMLDGEGPQLKSWTDRARVYAAIKAARDPSPACFFLPDFDDGEVFELDVEDLR